MQLILDPVMGMAGDMFVAALINLGAPEKETVDVMNYAGNLLGIASVKALPIMWKEMEGTSLLCQYQLERKGVPANELSALLDKALDHFSLRGLYREFAELALHTLSQAEGRVHQALENSGKKNKKHAPQGKKEVVHLHEAQDILVDITGSAFALEALNLPLNDINCFSPVYFGGGTVTFSHGTFPVPAPATQELIESWEIPGSPGPVEKELLTPTGAALLAAIGPQYKVRNDLNVAFARRGKIGIGFGTYDFGAQTELPNALFVYLKK
jgi:uncharacterized protein (DUF111 family)